MPINDSKLKKTSNAVSEDPQQTPPPAPPEKPMTSSELLAAARAKQDSDLVELQNSMDALSQEFARRAETIVRSGLQNSYSQARQRIKAIDLSFFDHGAELAPETINVLSTAPEETPC